MLRRFRSILLAALLASAPWASAEEGCAGPISTQAIVRKDPAQHLYVARINLADPRVSVEVASGGPDPDGPGPWETVMRATSVTAHQHDFALAINAGFFAYFSADRDVKKYSAGEGALAANLVVMDGKVVSRARDGVALWFDADGQAKIQLGRDVPPEAKWAVAGAQWIVTGGKNNAAGQDASQAPRTAAGLTADGKTLVLLVVDGRRPGWGLGMPLTELADEMIAQGCTEAINLDGGGSSTMVVRSPRRRYRVINTPSDGSTFVIPLSIERPVPYVLGVKLKN